MKSFILFAFISLGIAACNKDGILSNSNCGCFSPVIKNVQERTGILNYGQLGNGKMVYTITEPLGGAMYNIYVLCPDGNLKSFRKSHQLPLSVIFDGKLRNICESEIGMHLDTYFFSKLSLTGIRKS